MKTGAIICLEGIDGCGKDTQLPLLGEWLTGVGREVKLFNFPDYDGPLGAPLREALRDPDYEPHALQMLFSAERMRQLPKLNRTIAGGTIALTNRYRWTSFVYSVARGLEREWAEPLELPLPTPALTILIDIDVPTSLKRTGGTDVLERDVDMLARCRELYIGLAERFGDSWVIVDGTGEVDEVAEVVRGAVHNKLMKTPQV
ncbi:MAG: dTMP kinase [Flavobacteriales bacterium]|nr:dTMP kinase [Flavobacteriales bacterium]